MKKTDFALVVLIAGFATILAFVLTNVFLGDPNEEKVTVQYMDVISSGIDKPSAELFNALAINPTVETYVGDPSQNTEEEEVGTEIEDDDTENGETGDEQTAPEE